MDYIESLEKVCEYVSDWAAKVILDVYNVLTPNGRPFGYQDIPEEEQINDYIMLRGNEQAWAQYVMSEAELIIQRLTQSGLPSSEIAAVHPYDLAIKFAIEYSAHMETLIQEKANAQLNNPGPVHDGAKRPRIGGKRQRGELQDRSLRSVSNTPIELAIMGKGGRASSRKPTNSSQSGEGSPV